VSIPPPPKVNPSFIRPTKILQPILQPTQILVMPTAAPINCNRPHQSTREMERRRKQLEQRATCTECGKVRWVDGIDS
jgi:hypothetical protein